ncbi:hypothetical protein ABZX95_06250 [Streptomyces sp. NPDC004232]|uniref:hypothetical protein n=1 Tax=Streptomyces sp. NPDC004232 TaxID=3154454 RepID=UPI0033B2F0E2
MTSDDVVRVHRPCGLQVFNYPVDAARSVVPWRGVDLDAVAAPTPTAGDVDLVDTDEGTLAVVRTLGTSPYTVHRCPAKVTRCRNCGDPITVLIRFGETRYHFEVLDALPDPSGTVTLDEYGHVTRDLDAYPDGERYAIHRDRPARPANPNPLGLPRRAKPGLAPSHVTHVSRGDRESA